MKNNAQRTTHNAQRTTHNALSAFEGSAQQIFPSIAGIKNEQQNGRLVLETFKSLLLLMLLTASSFFGFAQNTADDDFQGPYEEDRKRWAAEQSKICRETITPDEVTVLRFEDEAELIIRAEGKDLAARQIEVRDLTGNRYGAEVKGSLLFAKVTLNSQIKVTYLACGKEEVLAMTNSLPHLRDEIIEVSNRLFNAIANRPRNISHEQWLASPDNASYVEKLSLLQKHLMPNKPLDQRLKNNDVNELYEKLYSPTLASELPCYCNNAPPVILPPYEETPCNCSYIVSGTSQFKNEGNNNSTPNHSIWYSSFLSGVSDGEGRINYQHPDDGRIVRHFTDHWRTQLGASFDTKLAHEGWCSGFHCAPERGYKHSNLDQITWPVTSAGSFGAPNADYQYTAYGLYCSSGNYTNDCGCEKEVEAIFNYGYRLKVNTEIGNGPNNNSMASGFIGASAFALYRDNPNPIVVKVNAQIIEERCNSAWNEEWATRFGQMAAATWAVAQGIIADPITFSQVTPQMVNDLFTTKIQLLQTNLISRTCGGNQNVMENALIPDPTSTKLILGPNKYLYFFVAGFYDIRSRGKRDFKNEVNLQTYAGLATRLDRGSKAVGLAGDSKLCCSKSYGNYLLASSGANIRNNLQEQHKWANSFLFALAQWEPQFLRGFANRLLIEGNYGRMHGPADNLTCPNPIPVPLHKKEFDVDIFSNDKEIYIRNSHNLVGIEFAIYDVRGKSIKSGITSSIMEKILSVSDNAASGIYIVSSRLGENVLNKKILIP